jgi:hypothetical protein
VPDDPADELYDLAPEDFVRGRDELVRRLRADGDRDAAATVKALRRPSAGAWALNQVARGDDADRVTTVVELGDRFRDATQAALEGDAAPLRDVQAAARPAVDALVAAAMQALADHGRAATDDLRRRVADTIHAALVDDEVAGRLAAGRLVEDQTAPGFGFAAGQEPATARRASRRTAAPQGEDELAIRRARAEAARRDQERARELQRLERRATEAERTAEEAEATARQLRADADAARAEADAARAEADAARAEADAARAEADAARAGS